MPKSLDELKNEYDIIVIGGGLGGLTCANRLAKSCGYKILLLEQHTQLGGLATWFTRKGHIFDVSLHGFPIGMKKTCRKYWNDEIASHIVQLKGIRFSNPQFELETTFDEVDFTNLLINKFRVKEETVKAFFKEVRGMNFYDDQNITTRELFNKYFPEREDIIRLLMEPITYANGSTLSDPAITYGIVFSNFMSKGVYTFSGGTDKFIDMMQLELEKNNVDIGLGCLVDKVLIEKGKIKGVIVGNRTIRAKAVVSNGNLLSLIFKLIGKEHFATDFIQEASQVRLNNSSCQVYMGIRDGEHIDYAGDLLFTSTAPRFDVKLLLSRNITSRTFSFYYPYTRPGRERYTIVASMNANYEDWSSLSKAEYKASKKELIEDTLNIIENYVPNVKSKIDYIEAATPLTIQRYTLHEKGASFGTKFEGLKISSGLNEQISGLFHTGSVAIIMSGWLGAANYGVIVANEVDKYLFRF